VENLKNDSITFRYFEFYQGGGSVGKTIKTNDINYSGGLNPLPYAGFLPFSVSAGSERVTGFIDVKLTGNSSILLSELVVKY
jgi:hypothetical protein